MATIVEDRASHREGWIGATSLALLALLIGIGLRVWQSPPAAEQVPGVELADTFSPEAVRVRNTSASYRQEALSPEAVRMWNAGAPAVEESLSPELMRIRNSAGEYEAGAFSPEAARMRNGVGFPLGSDQSEE